MGLVCPCVQKNLGIFTIDVVISKHLLSTYGKYYRLTVPPNRLVIYVLSPLYTAIYVRKYYDVFGDVTFCYLLTKICVSLSKRFVCLKSEDKLWLTKIFETTSRQPSSSKIFSNDIAISMVPFPLDFRPKLYKFVAFIKNWINGNVF